MSLNHTDTHISIIFKQGRSILEKWDSLHVKSWMPMAMSQTSGRSLQSSNGFSLEMGICLHPQRCLNISLVHNTPCYPGTITGCLVVYRRTRYVNLFARTLCLSLTSRYAIIAHTIMPISRKYQTWIQ